MRGSAASIPAMPDESLPVDASAKAVCPWCSTVSPAGTVTCPTCGANLTNGPIDNVPGVTAVDVDLLTRKAPPPSQPRVGLLGWISGDTGADPLSPADVKAIAYPDDEVRREIRRMELEARVANLQAEADANLTDAVVEGRAVDIPPDLLELAPEELVAAVEPTGTSTDDGTAGSSATSDADGVAAPGATDVDVPAPAADVTAPDAPAG